MTDYGKYIDPQPVRNQAVKIITTYGSPQQPWLKAAAIQHWIRNNIYYVSDPTNGEYVARGEETLECRGGDCEDVAILFCSLCEAVGVRSFLYVASFNKSAHAFASSYCSASYPNGLREDIIKFYKQFHIGINGVYTLDHGTEGIYLLVNPHSLYAGDVEGLIRMGYLTLHGSEYLWTGSTTTYQMG